MNIDNDWNTVKRTFDSAIKSSKHTAIATSDQNGNPHITPVGFVFLGEKGRVFYFEKYSKTIPENLTYNKNVCLLLVNSSTGFWASSLFKGRFSGLPGIRLYGQAGELRKPSPEEERLLAARIGIKRRLRGSQLIWDNMDKVRDIHITALRPIEYPRMMEHLL